MTEQSRPRGPGITYATLTVVLLVLLGTFALTSLQPPPPTIAEFAPQAVEQITDSPSEQSSRFGQGNGGGDGDLVRDPVTGKLVPRATPPPIDVPRVRRCIGDPPRQIEDPQSPPCVPYWSGDNGGATSKGVTRNQINVVTASNTNSNTNLSPEVITALERFFNQRFEFYGRQLNLINPPGAGGSDPEPAQRAAAVNADEVHQAFASTAYRNAGGEYYHEELANRRIVSAMGFELTLTRAAHRAKSPYLWAYDMAADRMFTGIGQWVCARLADGNATHGDPSFSLRKRTFGVLLAPHPRQSRARRPSTQPLRDALVACGVEPAYYEEIEPGSGGGWDQDGYGNQQRAQNTMLNMRRAEVTTVICLCTWQYAQAGAMPAATSQGYYPEWLFSSFGNLDNNLTMKVAAGNNPAQIANAFGLTFRPRLVPLDQEPYMNALREVDPELANDPNEHQIFKIYSAQEFYRSLLLIASGIQMAGPRLTPDTFEQALHRTRFPNPPHPTNPGAVGFTPGTHDMMLDAAEWWWGTNARSPYAGDSAGSFCYVDRGARRKFGQWPRGDVFFQGPCHST